MRVVYKPLKRLREESGLLSRTVTYTYRQETELHNTRTEPATISFTDQLPRSENEKLKVRLINKVQSCSPSLADPIPFLRPSPLSPSFAGDTSGASAGEAEGRSSSAQPSPHLLP